MNEIDTKTSDEKENKNGNGCSGCSEGNKDFQLRPVPNDKPGIAFSSKEVNPNIKNLPSQVFINQEYYNKFYVSKAKDDYNIAGEVSELVEVSFKNKRRVLFKNSKELPLLSYQYVIVEVENGLDIGTVTSFGKCADSKFHTIYQDAKPEYTIIRHAKIDDMEKYKKNLDSISEVLKRTREFVSQFKLEMKVTDADWQFDSHRLTIFFTAPMRIDFRQLVKELARTFKTRIELRQISTREEAKRIGGMGSCGRSLCCSTFCQDQCHVTLEHARTQQLSNNVAKLSGYCGRLKCCLLYEFNTYVDKFKDYPSLDSTIKFKEGIARILKADIFKEEIHTYIPDKRIYKTITFKEFADLGKNGKVRKVQDNNGNLKDLRKMLVDHHDEDDINELKKLEG